MNQQDTAFVKGNSTVSRLDCLSEDGCYLGKSQLPNDALLAFSGQA